jgi:DNA-binding response OmpR family regulator
MGTAAQLLLVSPDRTVLLAVERCALALGYVPHAAASLLDARRLLSRLRVDLVCLDSVLPRHETERFWRWLSGAAEDGAPAVVLLAARNAAALPGALPAFFRPKLHGLVRKPVDGRELARELARVLAAGSPRDGEPELLRVGTVTLDGDGRRLLFASGASLSPTPTEYRLLRYLMERPGRFLPPEELLQNVWKYAPNTGGPEVVRAHVSNLRRKLRDAGADPQIVRTAPYQGYGFVVDGG